MTWSSVVASLTLTCIAVQAYDEQRSPRSAMIRRMVIEGNGAIGAVREKLTAVPTDGAVLLHEEDAHAGAEVGIGDPGVPDPTKGVERLKERRKWLVFTSAGDHSNVAQWLPGRLYDVMVTYYGEPGNFSLKNQVDIYRERKDCKFCNLKHWREQEPALFETYSAIAVFDDDVKITTDGLNRLFGLREHYKLWITSPTMYPQHHTWYNNLASLSGSKTRVRLVPFIEMTCPLFNKDKLFEFLDVFDNRVKGWGTDVWYTQFFGSDILKQQAVADCVTAENPPTRKDTGVREILSTLGSDDVRQKEWLDVATELNLSIVNVSQMSKSLGDLGNESDLSWPCAFPSLDGVIAATAL